MVTFAIMQPPIEIETPRLVLRGVTPAYVHHWVGTRGKAEVVEHFGLLDADYDHYLRMHRGGMETHRYTFMYFTLVMKETGRAMGEAGYHTWDVRHHRAELFYRLPLEGDRGQGHVTEALPHIIGHGFGAMGLHRISAMIGASNEPSLRLVRRLGFNYEGTHREDYLVNGRFEDSLCHALLQHEWKG